MTELMTLGMVLGLSAGLAPGPLLALVVSETLQHGFRSGMKVAIAPFFTDLPIIGLTVWLFSQLSGFEPILGYIALMGGAFVLYMGLESMNPKAPGPEAGQMASRSLVRGILANVLSPHPYLFWLSVGGPIISNAASQGIAAPLAFLGSFYAFLVGSKIVLAGLIGRSRFILSGSAYRWIMRILGLALCVLALLLFRDGLRILGAFGF